MNELFAVPGFSAVAVAVAMFHAASIIICGLIVYEYVRIHRKRMALLSVLDRPSARHSLLERIILVCAYILTTAMLIGGTFAYFLTYLA